MLPTGCRLRQLTDKGWTEPIVLGTRYQMSRLNVWFHISIGRKIFQLDMYVHHITYANNVMVPSKYSLIAQ